MMAFVNAVLAHGFVLLIPQGSEPAYPVQMWFGDKVLSCHPTQHEHAYGGTQAWHLSPPLEDERQIHYQSAHNSNILAQSNQPSDSLQQPRSTSYSINELSQRHLNLLHGLAIADFVSAANEHFTAPDHYFRKVQSWFASSHCIRLEVHTGVEYFAQLRAGLWMMVSIGLQSASDRGRVTLRQFLYEGHAINPECVQDHIGHADAGGMDDLRRFLHESVLLLAGPNMSLIHDVHFDKLDGIQFAKIELCRDVRTNDSIEEHGDLSYISRRAPGFMTLFRGNLRVAAEAMRTVFDDTHERNMGDLFEKDNVSIAIYKEYDIAKAIRVVPHAYAVNRRRYAGILAHRRLDVPTAQTAVHNHVTPTQRIHRVTTERVAVNHEWLVLIMFTSLSIVGAGIAAFAVSLDSRVTSADLLTVTVTILIFLMFSLPQLYVSVMGGGYTIGEFFRGCVPIAACLRRHDVAFLKECVSRGVDVENFVSGRFACFLMNEARGRFEVGPVQIRDLDDRWTYGINGNGELCMRYRNKVGVLQPLAKKCPVSGRILRWWHCAVIAHGEIMKGVLTSDVKIELGDGEVG